MSGYVIAQIKDIKDKEIYKDYVSKVTPIVEKFGGKFLPFLCKSSTVGAKGFLFNLSSHLL